jgi:hypothetical protein
MRYVAMWPLAVAVIGVMLMLHGLIVHEFSRHRERPIRRGSPVDDETVRRMRVGGVEE